MKGIMNKYGMLIVLIVLFLFFAISSSAFLAPSNLINITRQIAMLGIAAVGVTFVILTAGMDLSVGSVLALSGIVSAIAMVKLNANPAIAVILGLLTGAIIGLINGIIVTSVKIPPFITTLATMQIFRGICFILTGGLPVYGFPSSFDFIGKGYILNIPVPVIVMVLLFIIGWVVINKTRYGRHLYAIGGNIESARLSGINVKKELLLTYVLCGLFAAVAGVIMLSRISSGQPNMGNDFGLDVVTAVVLGGISIMGGEGKFTGVIYGVLIMGVLSNGLILLNVYDYYQYVVKGVVLLLAVGFDQYSKYQKSKKHVKKTNDDIEVNAQSLKA